MIKVDKELVHVWNECHNCGASPIVGKRFHCESCPDGPDNDLCEPCYEKYRGGEIRHPVDDSPAAHLEITEHRFTSHEGKPITLHENWLEVNHPEAPVPLLADHFVVRPIFTAGLDSVIGGYAFAAKIEGSRQPLLLTALHVMDEMIKQKGIDCTDDNKGYTGRELPAIVTNVDIYNVFAPNWMLAPLGSAGPMLVLPNAGTGDEEPYSDRDIAAFFIKDVQNINPAPLASQAPKVGDPVWVAAQSPEYPGQRIFKAVVVEITNRSMVFKFENLEKELRYTSGAPVVNKDGEVVGINVGGGEFKKQKVGHANHVENIRRHLKEAIK
jgi:hypothetical protein